MRKRRSFLELDRYPYTIYRTAAVGRTKFALGKIHLTPQRSRKLVGAVIAILLRDREERNKTEQVRKCPLQRLEIALAGQQQPAGGVATTRIHTCFGAQPEK
jgi:hypothetical protein